MNELPKRKNIRLKGYDYSQAGYYFVTICTQDKKNLLCKLVGNDALVVPTLVGEKTIQCFYNISKFNKNIEIDSFCLMPNHIHGVIVINNSFEQHIKNDKKYGFEIPELWGHRSLPCVIRHFKSVTTRYYNKLIDTLNKNTLWQKSYYEHVIRNEIELQEIREYIINNPAKWQLDKYFI